MVLTANQIAVIQDAGGVCQHCRKPCRYPWQRLSEFVAELQSGGAAGLAVDAQRHPRRYLIQAVHINRDRSCDRRENLKPLCISCAMSFRAVTRRKPVFGARRKYL
ncbi:MAG: hypothetical protein F6J95_023910 [Leptolyngbya sp. SIO1E4]|nr:hypothetical protein [Leptolyngbya sp. SIO1E4]